MRGAQPLSVRAVQVGLVLIALTAALARAAEPAARQPLQLEILPPGKP